MELTTRERLLESLKSAGAQPVRLLRQKLEISSVAVRQHLSTLERDGLVARRAERRSVGRPEYLYSLTSAAEELFPKGYDRLACDLLHDVRATLGENALQVVLRRRLERQTDDYRRRILGSSATDRLREVARLQDENGFMAEARDGEIVQRNCSICSAAREFPVLCELEQELFETLLEQSLERVEHVLLGDSVCRYRVAATPTATEEIDGRHL